MATSRFLYLCGRLFNNAARLASLVPTASPSESSLFGVAKLADGFTEVPFMFGSVVADSTITWDFNLVANGNMASTIGADVASWTEANTGTGNVAADATGGVSSGPGMKLTTGAASTASAYQDVSVRPGEQLTIVGQLKTQAGKTVRIRVQNRLNLKWYNGSTDAWQTSQADMFANSSTTSFVSYSETFSVESLAVLSWPSSPVVTLRIYIATDDASVTGVWADDVYMWPSWSWFSVHGHDLQPQLAFQLRRSTDNFASSDTLESTLTVYKPAFYYALGSGVAKITDRYARVKLSGTPSAAMWFGEIVFGQYSELVTSFSTGSAKVRYYRDQIRTRPSTGTFRALALAQLERRVWSATFQDLSAAGLADFLENVERASGFGDAAIVFAPDDLDPKLCLYGQVPSEFTASYINLAVDTRDLEITEDPFPTFVA